MVASLDLSAETQFCAVTFFLPDGRAFVAFRGTDESIVGWKEDFNLAFSQTVPAQEKSVPASMTAAVNNAVVLFI